MLSLFVGNTYEGDFVDVVGMVVAVVDVDDYQMIFECCCYFQSPLLVNTFFGLQGNLEQRMDNINAEGRTHSYEQIDLIRAYSLVLKVMSLLETRNQNSPRQYQAMPTHTPLFKRKLQQDCWF